jgi:hypothetical protein
VAGLVWGSVLLLVILIAGATPARAAGRRSPTLAPANTVIDGPSADILGLSGMAVARDGTGGLVYLKRVAGIAHVFVSTLANGSFQPPVQVDTGLPGSSSQPVIAATNGGLLLVSFINGGGLYAAEEPSSSSAFGAPDELFAGASNPAISMSTLGKAYLAFTANATGGGHHVRAAYFNQGQWGLESTPLDANPSDNSGTGLGRPDVAAAGDGVGIVAWGESGHIYTRRVWGTSPSLVYEQADPSSFAGWNEVSASLPSISSGGDSSYAAVVFQETLASGAAQQSRVLMNRLHGSQYDGPSAGDGLTTPGAEGAAQPQVAVNEFGRGFVTAAGQSSDDVFATTITTNESPGNALQVNTLPQSVLPDAVPGTAGTISTLIAWQQNPGAAGPAEIRLRYAPDGSDLDPEEVVSNPALGATDANLGLAAGGDLAGDAAVAWVQGSGAQTEIVAAQLFQAPGGMTPSTLFQYTTTVTPAFAWSPASELWGSPEYVVKVDGVPVATTTANQVASAIPLNQGRQTWQVTATNLGGLASISRNSTMFIDTYPPRVSFSVSGPRHIGSFLHLVVRDSDVPPGQPPSVASGIKSVQVKWGDGANYFIRHGKFHAYKRRGRFTVTVIVKDRAGNKTIVTQVLKITPKPKPKPKSKGKPHKHHSTRARLAGLRWG